MKHLSEERIQQTEKLIRKIMKESDACGLAACIIDNSGNTVYEQFFGSRRKDHDLPVDGNTVFGLASVTKSFTALALLKMAEDGILSPDDPLSAYIPSFTNRNTKTVTLSHLLCHSGGFFPQPRIVVEETARQLGLREDRDHDLAYNEILAEEGGRMVAERLDSLTMENGLIGEPGRYCSYCNDGFGLISEVIRKYGGCSSYAAYLQEKILGPLQMERSFCDFIRPAEDDNAAWLYEKKDGVMHEHRNYRDDAFVLNGGGAMKSTLNDLKKYLTMYLHEGEGVVSADSIAEMLKPRLPFGTDGFYCYGLYTDLKGPYRIYQHGGSLPGVSSNILFSYDAGCAVIVLCNTSDTAVSVISDALFALYTDQPYPKEKTYPDIRWPASLIEAVKGHYESGEGTVFDVTEENGILSVVSKQDTKRIRPLSGRFAVVCGKRYDAAFEPVSDDRRGCFAVRYGSRIIPRCQNKES